MLANLRQPGLDPSLVDRTHPQEELLAGRQRLQLRVGEFVEHPRALRSHRAGDGRHDHLQRRVDLGRLEQLIDHFDQSVVEVASRVAQFLERPLQGRIDARVDADRLAQVGRFEQRDVRRVAQAVVGADEGQAVALFDHEPAGRRIHRPEGRGGVRPAQVVDRRRQPPGKVVDAEHRFERLQPEQIGQRRLQVERTGRRRGQLRVERKQRLRIGERRRRGRWRRDDGRSLDCRLRRDHVLPPDKEGDREQSDDRRGGDRVCRLDQSVLRQALRPHDRLQGRVGDGSRRLHLWQCTAPCARQPAGGAIPGTSNAKRDKARIRTYAARSDDPEGAAGGIRVMGISERHSLRAARRGSNVAGVAIGAPAVRGRIAAAGSDGLRLGPPRSARPGGAGRTHHPDRLAGHHAGDRRADDPRDVRLRLVVPRLEHPRPLPARLGVLRRHRARRLVDPVHGDHPARRRGVAGLVRARPCQAGRCPPVRGAARAARDPGRVARLEVAVHLSPRGSGEREPAGGARRRAAALQAHLGERLEHLLRAAARQHDLHDERHAHPAIPACRRARHLPRDVGPLQRRRLLRHALPRAFGEPRGVHRLVEVDPGSRPDARRAPATPRSPGRARCRHRPTARWHRICSTTW